ncbi:MAG: hypothetical protein PHD97_03105 [Bacteroidales bacterium]|nr:hypothetical protein [Bacteroidales bacterium]
MKEPEITFFMMVTNKCLLVTDYTIKSYRKIKNINFRLLIYSNWIDEEMKKINFPKWRNYDFVDIIENTHQTDDKKPTQETSKYFLMGPFERNDVVWDNELSKINTPFIATVDSDFEILNPEFIYRMFDKLKSDSNLIAMSTDYNPLNENYYDTYSRRYITLNERWSPWFCIYKKDAFKCKVSHLYHKEIIDGKTSSWDSSGYFQKALNENFGYKLEQLEWKYQPCFIHYENFSKNTQLTKKNIGLYRFVKILGKRELLGHGAQIFIFLSKILHKIFFNKIDRTKFIEW